MGTNTILNLIIVSWHLWCSGNSFDHQVNRNISDYTIYTIYEIRQTITDPKFANKPYYSLTTIGENFTLFFITVYENKSKKLLSLP